MRSYQWTESGVPDIRSRSRCVHETNARSSGTRINDTGLNALIIQDYGLCLERCWHSRVLFSRCEEPRSLFSQAICDSLHFSRLRSCKTERKHFSSLPWLTLPDSGNSRGVFLLSRHCRHLHRFSKSLSTLLMGYSRQHWFIEAGSAYNVTVEMMFMSSVVTRHFSGIKVDSMGQCLQSPSWEDWPGNGFIGLPAS